MKTSVGRTSLSKIHLILEEHAGREKYVLERLLLQSYKDGDIHGAEDEEGEEQPSRARLRLGSGKYFRFLSPIFLILGKREQDRKNDLRTFSGIVRYV